VLACTAGGLRSERPPLGAPGRSADCARNSAVQRLVTATARCARKGAEVSPPRGRRRSLRVSPDVEAQEGRAGRRYCASQPCHGRPPLETAVEAQRGISRHRTETSQSEGEAPWRRQPQAWGRRRMVRGRTPGRPAWPTEAPQDGGYLPPTSRTDLSSRCWPTDRASAAPASADRQRPGSRAATPECYHESIGMSWLVSAASPC